METHDDRKVALALPHHNRFKLLCECVEKVIDDPRIGEVVISDDCSTDGSYDQLQEWFKNDPKIKLFRNTTNLDCYRNKQKAVERATLEWVILIDDDNVIGPDYLDILYGMPEWSGDFLYCPDFAKPHFDYRAFSGEVITKKNVSTKMSQRHFTTALNTANYFFCRNEFLKVWDGSVNPHTADTIFHAYNWLASGRSMKIVPGLRYFHRVHEGSHYKRNCHKTGVFEALVETKLRNLR